LNKRQTDSPDNRGLLSIGSVVREVQEIYPSVTQSSLRFLEREGLIEPTRTPGGHRLYSRSDIERILQIKAWQDQRLTLDQIRDRLEQRDRLSHPEEISDAFLQLVLGGNLIAARRLVLDADTLGMSLSKIFGEVLQPALNEVGNRWEHGRVLVAQEKETSEFVRDIIAELSQRHDRSTPSGASIVAASVHGERHELGLRMINGLLRAEGCRMHYLGADVAHEFLTEAIVLHRPDLVLLSVKLEQNIPEIGKAARHLREARVDPAPRILAGGEAVPAHSDRVRAWGVIPITDTTFDGVIATVLSHLGDRGEARERR
jgi:MerR family transcriptional regulator, light-induced transcriptional regulator